MPGGSPRAVDFSFSDVIGQTSVTDWGWGGHQWTSSARVAKQGIGQINRYGANSSLSWQIQSGDNPLGGTNTERNEVYNMFGASQTDESVASGTQYYAVSVYIPSPWTDPVGTSQWFIIAQIHGDDTNTGHSAQANVQLLLASNVTGAQANSYHLRTVGGAIGGSGSIDSANDKLTVLGAHVYDKWKDFVIAVTWSSTAGHVTAWMRTPSVTSVFTQVADYAAPTMYSLSGTDQTKRYWKRGIYRNGDSAQGTVTIYVSPFTRATTMAAACQASFGQYP